jgi:hypothetical protein
LPAFLNAFLLGSLQGLFCCSSVVSVLSEPFFPLLAGLSDLKQIYRILFFLCPIYITITTTET